MGWAAAGVTLLLAVGWAWSVRSPAADAVAADRLARPTPVAETAFPPATRVHRVAGAPERLMIFRLGVNAPVVPVAARSGTLIPPRDASRLGWWADGARPGDPLGSALVAGHSLHTGGGALQDLEQLRSGDRVAVRTANGGSLEYAVTKVAVYRKGELSRRSQEIFSQDVGGRLVLITCEEWDGERYLSNVVVTAEPTDKLG